MNALPGVRVNVWLQRDVASRHGSPRGHPLTDRLLPTMFVLLADVGPVPVKANKLRSQIPFEHDEAEWKRWS